MDKVRHTLKAHLCVIHHSGKDRAKGARGHSLLRAATDTELEVATNHVIRPRKQRDMTEDGNIGFELHTINLGKNVHEKIITTCVMMELELPPEDDFDDLDALTEREYIALGVLDENLDASQKIKFSEFKAKLMATEGFFEGQKRKSFLKAVSRVVDIGVYADTTTPKKSP